MSTGVTSASVLKTEHSWINGSFRKAGVSLLPAEDRKDEETVRLMMHRDDGLFSISTLGPHASVKRVKVLEPAVFRWCA